MQSNDELRRLLQRAEQCRSEGKSEESVRLVRQAQSMAPDHPLVLNTAAVDALNNGEPALARSLLERAIAADATQPAYWINLATTLRRLGLRAEELIALQRVLAIDPRHLMALLQKASLLELGGDERAAALVYSNALQSVPADIRLPEAMRAALSHARKVVAKVNDLFAGFLEERLAPARAAHLVEDVTRFEHSVANLLKKRHIYYPQPTLLHYPKLPAEEYFARAAFPWLDELESASDDIRGEFEQVYADCAQELTPYIAYPEGAPLDQWAELNHSRRWSVYYLWRDGLRVEEHLQRCPRTAEALARIPRIDIPGVAPTAFFSILDAHSHIPSHTGVTNARAIVHLPLVLPPDCRFRVGSDCRFWKPGEAWVFDDTIEHEAWNDSAQPRAILILDVWNPYLSKLERDLVPELVAGYRDFFGNALKFSAA